MEKLKSYFLIIIFLLLAIINRVDAKEKVSATLSKCVDGDTAYFIIDDTKTKVRFLAIDTPESTNRIDPYGKEASSFTCNKLKKADKIEIEYDIDKKDKYSRTLGWIFVDDKLLQKEIIEEGLGKVAYVYKDYKYVDELKVSEKIAKEKKLNIWSNQENSENNYIYYIFVILFIIFYILDKSFRNKTNRKIKRKIRNSIK